MAHAPGTILLADALGTGSVYDVLSPVPDYASGVDAAAALVVDYGACPERRARRGITRALPMPRIPPVPGRLVLSGTSVP